MKKILALIACLISTPSLAGVACSLPFQLQNNTVADATQVMANYNALVTCLGNAATAGANNDITSLTALSTPLTPTQGGTQISVGGTSTGSGNAQVVSPVVPSTFILTVGRQVTFVAGFSNTGATTLNVAGSGAVNLVRRTQLGNGSLVGGEIIGGEVVTVVFDGASYVLTSAARDIVGQISDYAGGSAPAGWLFLDGSCQVRATYPLLFAAIGTTYDPTGSTCDSAHFALPDGRGRVLVGQDTTGARITGAGSGCNGAALGGAGCGAQNVTISQANLPNYALPVTDPGHVHNFNTSSHGSNISSVALIFNSGGTLVGAGGSAIGDSLGIASATTGISVASGGSGTPSPNLPPLQIVLKIIKL
jgi:microcystin-dependent protein